MGLGKRISQYDPALKYMGLGKRAHHYDPALKYMGLGKRGSQYDPALKYMGLGKRAPQYDPALKYMGLGKRASQYDPALKFMGLGKRASQYDPALKFMGLGKRSPQYDPALKYMGLGKRNFQYDPALRYMGLGKRGKAYDPGLNYMGLGKRDRAYDPGLKYMGLGKRGSRDVNSEEYDHDTRYNSDNLDSSIATDYYVGDALSHAERHKRRYKFDPALKYMSISKREYVYDPAMKYMGLGKRKHDYTAPNFETFLDSSEDSSASSEPKPNEDSETSDSLKNELPGLFKRGLRYNSRYKNRRVTKGYIDDTFDRIPGLGKRPYKFDPALRLMGLGKRNFPNKDPSEFSKRAYKFDPALNYMGLGKRKLLDSVKEVEFYEEPSNDIGNKIKDNAQNNPKSRLHDDISENKFNVSSNEILDMATINNNLKNIRTIQQTPAPEYFSDVVYMGIDKRIDKFDPALLYMGLGRKRQAGQDHKMYYSRFSGNERNEDTDKYVGKPRIAHGDDGHISVDILELPNNFTDTKNCENGCLKRKKRSNTELEREDFTDGDDFGKLILAKRERDNRPRYNPGWIFIGLGKRHEGTQESPNENEVGFDSVSLNDYYTLLDKIKTNIEKMKFTIGDKEHGHSRKPNTFLLKMNPYDGQTEMDYGLFHYPSVPHVTFSDGIKPNTWLDYSPSIIEK